jgi:hypothetical protein
MTLSVLYYCHSILFHHVEFAGARHQTHSLHHFHSIQRLLIQYTLDVMHCEMNLAKNFLKTITGKKDTVKVKRDLQRRGIRRHLWLTKMFKPAASYVLSDDEFKQFVNCIESLKTPTGYHAHVQSFSSIVHEGV